jgi:hypothetical protein
MTRPLRRLICALRGHDPDGVVRGGDENMLGSVMWCRRRCGAAHRSGRWTS